MPEPGRLEAVAVHHMMQYNRLGKNELRISVVGFRTCQLRLVPDRTVRHSMICCEA
jgi:hypothetical protein